MTSLRPLGRSDAATIARLLVENRDFLAPWEPTRPEAYFTEQWQHDIIVRLEHEAASGMTIPFVILDEGEIAGRITLNNVVRGPFQSASVGYWVSQDRNGRGIATAAVAALVELAFGELGLHRLEAGTLLHNHGSQRVLARNGFVEYGRPPRYLQIDGRWQDHVLFQRLNEPG
jgi:ribosomal-protein-alanine N-acetyltransferase